MKKKIISLLLVTIISSTVLISCGKTETAKPAESTETTESSDVQESTPEPTAPADTSNKDSSIVGENNNPTVEVNQIATIADFKDKDKTAIETLLGKPLSEEETKSVYEKDNYTFEVTYSDSKCKQFKIIPKTEMKYPADGNNILKLIGINAGEADTTSPGGLEWNNKFDTSKINVVSNNETDGKIAYAEILLTE